MGDYADSPRRNAKKVTPRPVKTPSVPTKRQRSEAAVDVLPEAAGDVLSAEAAEDTVDEQDELQSLQPRPTPPPKKRPRRGGQRSTPRAKTLPALDLSDAQYGPPAATTTTPTKASPKAPAALSTVTTATRRAPGKGKGKVGSTLVPGGRKAQSIRKGRTAHPLLVEWETAVSPSWAWRNAWLTGHSVIGASRLVRPVSSQRAAGGVNRAKSRR